MAEINLWDLIVVKPSELGILKRYYTILIYSLKTYSELGILKRYYILVSSCSQSFHIGGVYYLKKD